MRVRNQLLTLVLSILLPAFIAAALAVGYVYRESQIAQDRNMSEAARAFAFNAQSELENNVAILRTLSHSPALQRGDLERFYAFAKRMVPTPESGIMLIQKGGRQLMNTRDPFGAALQIQRAGNIEGQRQDYGADKAIISDLFMAPAAKRYDFAIQVPVPAEQDPKRYLVMDVNAGLMQAAVSRPHLPPTWITTIADRQGVVVARSHEPERYVGQQLKETTRRLLASSRSGIYDHVTLNGIPVKAYYHRIENSDWSVLISIPREELRALPTRAASLLAGIMVLLLGMAVFAAHWFAQRAYRPVEQLGKAAEHLRQGQQVTYVPQGLHEVDSVGHQLAQASQQIRHATQELESRVAEAVAQTERAQQALLRGQKLEALGRLTGGIAHEFNNLLQTLMTALQVAKLSSQEAQVHTLLDTCQKAVDRATVLTRQLGAFGKIQESRQSTIDLNEHIKNFQKLMEGILPGNITFHLQLAPELWPVTIDTVQLELALLNIAINARDAMPNGGALTLETHNQRLDRPADSLPPGDYVRIVLTDTGTGMTPEVLAKALDPFFTTKATGLGTGLGLPQAYGFVRQSNGTLEINSQQGKGTSVEIFLPRAHSDPPAPRGPSKKMVEPQNAGGNILFVDDDPLVREAVAPALSGAGFSVQVATNADEALALLESEKHFDLMFSDIVMPGKLNGIDLAQAARRRYPDMKVLLATGYTERHVEQEDVQLIAKPYDITDVIWRIQQSIHSGLVARR